jgi:hypothetical protein
MRTAVEFMNLYCSTTRESNEDELSLKFDRATLWSGPMRSGVTRKIEIIKVIPDPTGTVELWHEDTPRRTINKLGTQTIRQIEPDSGARSIQFATEGGDYTLSYRLLQIPD